MRFISFIVLLSSSVVGCGGRQMSRPLPSDMGPGGTFPEGSFGAMCSGAPTTITGTALAPNGTDPVASAHIYVVSDVKPIPPGVGCEICGKPFDLAIAETTAAANGVFSLSLDSAPTSASLRLVISRGRFRRVSDLLVKPCVSAPAPASAVTLPGTSSDGDLPKIAVATGDSDHLDVVLDALGIRDFDCYNGSKSGMGSAKTPCGVKNPDVSTLLADPVKLAKYNMLFISCAPGKFASLANQKVIAANLEAWVAIGGRLFTTDESYNFVEQAFAPFINFYPGTQTPALAQTIDQGNLGVGASSKTGGASYMGTIVDAELQGWLQVVGAVPPEANTITLTGFLNPWAAQKDVSMNVKTEVVADAAYYTTAATAIGSPSTKATMPMTVEWDYQMCGRVLFSSYHTLSSTQKGTTFSGQEKILEYLMLDISSCVGPIG